MDGTEYKIGEETIKDDMVVFDSICVNIEFLKYIKLGYILSHDNLTPGMYTSIADIVTNPDFKSRYTDDVEFLFKDIPEIESVTKISNDNHDAAFAISPAFDGAVEVIRTCLITSNDSKRVLGLKKPTTVTIDISTIDKLSETMRKRIVEEYSGLFETSVNLITEFTSSFTNFDIYYINDMVRFNDVMIDPLNDMKFMKKHIVCSKTLPLNKLKDLRNDLIPNVFSNLEVVMTAAAQFHYIKPFMCLT